MSTHNSHSKKHLRKDQNTIGLCPFISATESQNLINSYNQANPKVFLMANGQLHSLPVLYTVQNHNQFLICGMMLDKPNHILYLNYMNLFFFHKLRISMNKTYPFPHTQYTNYSTKNFYQGSAVQSNKQGLLLAI